MPTLMTFARRMALLWILIGAFQPVSVFGGEGEAAVKPAVKYDTSQFTPKFLYPGGEVVISVEWLTQPEERVMALTFDDGPDERDLELTEFLKKQDIPATFFYIGSKVKLFPEVVKKVHADHFEIGYHSYRHQRLRWLSHANLAEDFRQGKEALTSLGVSTVLFRPPYGDFTEQMVRTAKDQGMETVLWTIDSRDWTGLSAETMAKNVTRQFHPGAVLLFHSQHPVTMRALPAILAAARKENYRFVSLGDWRRVVLGANCRMAGQGCSGAQTVASTTPTQTHAKNKKPPATVKPAASAPVKEETLPVRETPPEEVQADESEPSDVVVHEEGGGVPVLSRVVEPVITPISVVTE
ncbi:MAG: polysaccharide deacetylase family protein [Magnetococcales bacterium]|nr:polysaccharide deacetylase family protein [Magnetococcales bacterium]